METGVPAVLPGVKMTHSAEFRNREDENMQAIPDYEKLGVFYLGRPHDPEARKPQEGIILYKSRDLTTHAVCVGMTGSGKTGLCIGLLEEAAMDGLSLIHISEPTRPY